MSKKVIVVREKKRGCLWLCGVLVLVSLAIYALAFALCIAAGVALWFGIRYVWRRLVAESPDSGIVRAGMKLPPIGRKVAAGVVCAFVSLALIGAFGSTTQTTDTTQQPAEEQQSEPAAKAEPEPAEPENGADDDIVYADDEVVNEFITDYNAASQSPFTGVEDGNIRTKFYAYTYGFRVELLHANDTDDILVTISETDGKLTTDMRDVFHDTVRVLDPSLSDEEIYAYFDTKVSGGDTADTLGRVSVYYQPKSDSWPGRIELERVQEN